MISAETIVLTLTTFLIVILSSQYALALLPAKKPRRSARFSPLVSVLIPAHNEAARIKDAILSVIAADYEKKEIIVIDDGSTDATPRILRSLKRVLRGLKTIRTPHVGKAAALNLALRKARGSIIVVMDGDGVLDRAALTKIVEPFAAKKIGAATGVTRARNKTHLLTWFQNIEYAYFSFFNALCNKINATLLTPGVLSAYRKAALKEIGGFPQHSIVEDHEIALHIQQLGYKIAVAEDAISYTHLAENLGHFIRQRLRWFKGGLQFISANIGMLFNRRHLGIGYYSLPLSLYWYVHSALIAPLIIYMIVSGYMQYYHAAGIGFTFEAAQYFFYWLSTAGIFNLIHKIWIGAWPATPLMIASIAVTLLSQGLYIYALLRYDRRIGARDLFAILFFFPYILYVAFLQIAGLVAFVLDAARKTQAPAKWVKVPT